MNSRLRRFTLRSAAAMAFALLVGCGTGGGNNGGLQGFLPGFNNGNAASFLVTYSGGIPTVVAGSTTVYNLQLVSVNGFSAPVTFATNSLPSGSSMTFNPTTVTPTAAGAPFTATFTAPQLPGDYTFGVSASGGGQTQGAILSVHVVAAANPSFTVAVTPPSLATIAGQPGSFLITVTPQNGFTGTVTLSSPNINESLNTNFNPGSVTITNASAQTSTLTISNTAQLPGQIVHFTVTGSSGAITASGTGTLTINPNQQP
jgi:hypothetical protein